MVGLKLGIDWPLIPPHKGSDFRELFVTSPTLRQTGVIAYRVLSGNVRMLLMTSRDTGRWIIPKGNIGAGAAPGKMAEKEA